jgi:hypothetical protein
MTKPLISYRRIDHLKALALNCGFSNEDAKQFGKLTKTATWEALLETYGIPLKGVDIVDKTVDSKLQSLDTSGWANYIDIVDKTVDSKLQSLDTSGWANYIDSVDKTVDSKTESLDTGDWTNDASFPVCNFTPQNSTNFLEWVDFGQLIAVALASLGVFVLAMSLWRQINPLNLLPPVKVNIQIGTKL